MMKHVTGDTDLASAIEEYYAAKRLPSSTVDRLLGRRPPKAPARWFITGALAASAALVLLALIAGIGTRLSGTGGAGLPSQDGPKLVAVQIHADWCPRSPEVAPVFADLLSQYGNEPILFVSLDITDEVRRGQAELLAESLGVPGAFEEPFGSGMIKLIDRESQALIATITGNGPYEEFEFRLAEVLGKRPEVEPGS